MKTLPPFGGAGQHLKATRARLWPEENTKPPFQSCHEIQYHVRNKNTYIRLLTRELKVGQSQNSVEALNEVI